MGGWGHLYDPNNYTNLYIMYLDRISYISAPWEFQIVNILFKSRDTAVYRYVPIVNLELLYWTFNIMYVNEFSFRVATDTKIMKNCELCNSKKQWPT